MPRSALASSILLIAVATLTPQAATSGGSSGWSFTAGALPLTDACANILLFIPLGAALVWCDARASRAATIGLLLSLLIELLQSRGLPVGRFATVADLLANSVGALLGALIARHRDRLLHPSTAAATWLSLGWTVGVCGVFLATAWMLAPISTDRAIETPPRASALPYAPGFPWFPGEVDDVVISGVRLPHNGTGPVRVEASWSARAGALREGALSMRTLGVAAAPADRTLFPLVYVHAPGDTAPQLIVAKRGGDLLLWSGRRGDGRGVRMPRLELPDVADAGVPLMVKFGVGSESLHLSATYGTRTDSAKLLLTPALGWIFAQNALGDAPLVLATGALLWLLALVAPAFYWGSWTTNGRSVSLWLGMAAALTATLWLSGRRFGLATIPGSQWGAIAGAAVCAIGLARWVRARQPVSR